MKDMKAAGKSLSKGGLVEALATAMELKKKACVKVLDSLVEVATKRVIYLDRLKQGLEERCSLKFVVKRVGELMGEEISCVPDCKATDEVKGLVGAMGKGGVMILENTCFYKGETKNDLELAESVASLTDLLVNNAYGTVHCAHSCMQGEMKFLRPCVWGVLMKKELEALRMS